MLAIGLVFPIALVLSVGLALSERFVIAVCTTGTIGVATVLGIAAGGPLVRIKAAAGAVIHFFCVAF